MLKFVTTKPPRGRSPSGSGTPDRDHRASSHETSPSRGHYSPRFLRKHYSGHTYTQSDPRTPSFQSSTSSSPSASAYRPLPSSSRTYYGTQTGEVKRRRTDVPRGHHSPTDSRQLSYSDQQFYQRRTPSPLQHQQQYRHSHPIVHLGNAPHLQQQYIQQPQQQGQWSHHQTKYSYKQATPSESSGNYATLRFPEPHSGVFIQTPKESKFPLEVQGLYSSSQDKPQSSISQSQVSQTSGAQATSISRATPTISDPFKPATGPVIFPEPPKMLEPFSSQMQPGGKTQYTINQSYSAETTSRTFSQQQFNLKHPGSQEPQKISKVVTKTETLRSQEPYKTMDAVDGKEKLVSKERRVFEESVPKEEVIVKEVAPKKELVFKEVIPKDDVFVRQTYIRSPSTRRKEYQKKMPAAASQKPLHTSSLNIPVKPAKKEQVMTTCVPQVTTDLSNEALNKNQSSMRSVGMSSQTQSTMSSTMRDMLNKSQEQAQIEGSLSLDVVYITERIISMTFPSEGHDTTYSFNLKEVVRMLKTKHGDNYLILNLSEKRQDLTKANPQVEVKDYGWPDHLAPPLERLCSLCKAIDSWLNADIRNVVVLHCKGGRSRIASVIAAYMHYSNICASADQALDRFAMKRFYDDKLGGLPLPSQRRYVRYFSGLLSGAIKINSNPLYLHHILIHGVPNFDTKGGCRPFIKVYQGMQPIFTSGVYNVTDNMQKVCISISPGIPLRGDILIKCYHKKTRSGQREVMWQCQFHTCAISDNNVIFSKQELDDAVMDPRFPDNGKVEFVFGPSSDVLVSVSGFKSDVTVPVDDNEETLARSDSYENFHRALDALDFNDNGISSTQASVARTHVSTVRGVEPQQSSGRKPIRTGHKRGGPPPSSSVQQQQHHGVHQNGHSHLTNGSITSSLDSGYAGHNQSFNSHFTSSAATTNNINNNTISSSDVIPSYNSQVHQPNQSNSTLTRKTVQTLEERTQLDELLSDLLSEQAFVSPNQRSPRTFQTAVQSQQAPVSPGSNLATSPSMSGAKTVTTTTRTFTSYSNTDSHRNPDKVLIQRAEVSYKVPGQGEVKDHYTIAADPSQMLDTSPTRPPANQYHPKGVPNNAFSYTAGMSSSQQSQHSSSSQRAEVIEHEVMRSPISQGLQSPPSSRLPYRPDYDPKFDTTSSSYSYSSVDGDNSSWLAQQQQKLKNFKEGRDPSGRTEQEKKLVNELRFAQNKYYTRRTEDEEEERAIMDSYNRPYGVQNGPVSPERVAPERVAPSYAPPQRSTSTSAVDGPWSQDHSYNTSYSTSSYVESRSFGDKRSNKPPPSPTMQRTLPASSAPVPVPIRSSSKDYMRTRSNSSSTNWQQQQQQRPLQRQQSDNLYDRNVEHIQPRSYGSTHSTPPHSPRAISPSGPHSTTTYTTYRTIEREREKQEEMQRAKRAQQQQAPPPQPQPPQQINHHYITEVFVHRTDLNKDKTDSTTRLDELEKNLEAASQSIKASKSSQQQSAVQAPVQRYQQPQVFEETVQHSSSRQYHTYQETKPEPPRVKEIEEDRIMLRPIGPGMQTLEPESAHTGTLGRPTTPGFPTGPATPPFPVSPRTPYQNTVPTPSSTLSQNQGHIFTYSSHGGSASSLSPPPRTGSRQPVFRDFDPTYATIPEDMMLTVGGPQFISPTGTLQAPQQQQQHQTIQYQQYQQQQYQTQSNHQNGQGHDTLHIDTSPKMLISPRSPSAGSPSSPGNLNTLRQQLSSAHSMSSSVVSPGPHSMTGQSSPSVYFGLSRRGSLSSLADSDMMHTTPKFVKDTSKFWYKPNISREEAIQLLKDKHPGTFVIRDSNSFPGAFGLALKVATIPPNVQAKPSGDPQADLVRHFLIEPTPKGVRLRGCSNEPVFGSLAALVYQHSITPLALPCKLALPEADSVDGLIHAEVPMSATELNSAATLLAQGAACNVIFINTVDMESLTGPQAVAKAVKMTFENLVQGRTTMVHFKVSIQGITLTDNNRRLFFRRHYPVSAVTYCGMDPQDRRWKREIDAPGVQGDARIFGFVARKQGSSTENSCHIFAELDPEQPASAIVNFVTKVMIGQSKVKS